MQPEFLRTCLEGAKERGLHTAVDTCGHAARAAVLDVADAVDLFLFDVKVVDSHRHRELTGVDNALILDNLAFLARSAPGKVLLRLPLIPECTDEDANLEAIAARQPAVVVPGHLAANGALDISAVNYTREYLLAFEEEVTKAVNSDALIAAMNRRYPGAGLAPALQIGAKVAKGEMKWG